MVIEVDYDPKYKKGILRGDYLENIREYFSVKDESANIRQQYNTFAPRRKYAITPTGRFDVGLLAEIYKYIQSLRLPIDISVSDEFKSKFKPSYTLENAHISALKLPLRDYQTESIQKCIKQGNGVLKLATAAGKTLIIAALIKTLHEQIQNHFTVIIVPSIQLVEQTYKDFVEYGFQPETLSKFSGTNAALSANIIIIGSQLLMVSKNIPELLYNADLLVIDECIRKGQFIQTKDKHKPIEDIIIGDKVLSFNLETKQYEYQSVLKTFKNLQKSNLYNKFIKIELEDSTSIEVTPNHKIYTSNRGYVRAEEVTVDDDIIISFAKD